MKKHIYRAVILMVLLLVADVAHALYRKSKSHCSSGHASAAAAGAANRPGDHRTAPEPEREKSDK